MAYFFEDINVLIDGSPIICQNASINFDNSLSSVYPIGFQGSFNQIPTNAIKNNFQFSYLIRPDVDPPYNIINNLRNYLSQSSSAIVVGALSGEGYLDSYSIRSSPNQPSQASVSFVGFTLLSGALQAKQVEVNKSGDFTGICHGWTTFLGDSGNLQSQPVYSLDYSFRANWIPTYVLGNQKPLQVDFTNASEEIRFTTETFNNLSFSGTNLSDSYVDVSNVQYLLILGLDLLTNNGGINYLSFDLTNHKITRTNLSAALDSMVTTEVTTVKYY